MKSFTLRSDTFTLNANFLLPAAPRGASRRTGALRDLAGYHLLQFVRLEDRHPSGFQKRRVNRFRRD